MGSGLLVFLIEIAFFFEISFNSQCARAHGKRAFSVSGLFRKLLSDLITYLHNSNRTQHQTTLTGEIIENEKFAVIGFVPADVVRLKEDVWFQELDSESIKRVNEHITGARALDEVQRFRHYPME